MKVGSRRSGRGLSESLGGDADSDDRGPCGPPAPARPAAGPGPAPRVRPSRAGLRRCHWPCPDNRARHTPRLSHQPASAVTRRDPVPSAAYPRPARPHCGHCPAPRRRSEAGPGPSRVELSRSATTAATSDVCHSGTSREPGSGSGSGGPGPCRHSPHLFNSSPAALHCHIRTSGYQPGTGRRRVSRGAPRR